MFQTFLLTKTVVHVTLYVYRGAQPLFHVYFGVKTLSETLFFPPLMKLGDGARYLLNILAELVELPDVDLFFLEDRVFANPVENPFKGVKYTLPVIDLISFNMTAVPQGVGSKQRRVIELLVASPKQQSGNDFRELEL